MRTYSPKPGEIQRQWHVIDATDVVLGRLASQTAQLLRGKHKPIFAPHVDTGDFVIIINAGKVALTGNKRRQQDRLPPLRLPGRPRAGDRTASCSTKQPGQGGREGRQGHAPAQHARPADGQQAEGLRRPGAPAPGPAAASRSRSPRSRSRARRDRPRQHLAEPPMSETRGRRDRRGRRDASPSSRRRPRRPRVRAPRPRHRRPSAGRRDRPPQGGHRPRAPHPRHRQAHAQRPHLEDYFPNKVHQQLDQGAARDPREGGAATTSSPGSHGGGVTGQAGALRLGIARALNQADDGTTARR